MKQSKDLIDQIPNSKIDIGTAIIQGMSKENEKKQISFEYHKSWDFIFKKIIKLIWVAIFEFKKTSPFDLKNE